MNFLALDTSGKNLTVIISYGRKKYVYNDKDCGVRHSVKVMPVIEELSEKAGISLSSLDFFACVVGAGSFTGIRIGVATVKALCFAYKKPCLSITSFDSMAYNKSAGKVMAIIDAGHGGYYVSGYNMPNIVYPPSYVNKEDLALLSKDYKLLSTEKVEGFKTETVDVSRGLYKAVVKNADKVSLDIDSLAPLYIRLSQAEEGRK